MGPEEVAKFISVATNSNDVTLSDPRIKDIISSNDSVGDYKMRRHDFLDFYRKACLQKIGTVRSNLEAYNYDGQLRRMPNDSDDINIMQARKDEN